MALSVQLPATKIQIQISCQDRVAADVYGFNSLGASLGSTVIETAIVDLREWETFFNPYQKHVPDEVGRAYTALKNLRGHFSNRSRNLAWWTDNWCRKCSLNKASLKIMSLL